MKKLLVCTVTVLAVATMGMALIHCGGGGNDYECTKNDDCDPGFYCDLTVHECKAETCTPNCTGKECGPDGCDGTCGTCPAGETCNAQGQCEGGCVPDTCADLGYECGTWDDGCGTDLDCGDCGAGETCNAQGQCEACTPDTCTDLGYECGVWDDGCGSQIECGTCPAGETCNAQGQCESGCTPDCAGRECGPDPICGESCGTCPAGESCDADGQCVACTPDCSGRECGPDPVCGESCGTCPAGESCNADGQCVACTPDCSGRECGPDPVCGESCGTCPAGEVCNADGQCEAGTTHDGAGDYCNPDAGTTCSEEAGAANTCLVTDTPAAGDGFCSFACSGDGADAECTADFPNGCCFDIDGGGNWYCVPEEYCGGGEETQGHLERCGTAEYGNCISSEGLICVGFGDDWGYCLYSCDPANPDCPGENDECGELNDGSGACIPPGDNGQGEFCSGFENRCAANLICIVASETAVNGYCTSFCNCDTGVGCPVGDPPSECALQLQSGECICGYQCSTTADCPNGAAGWDCTDLGGASFCLAQ